MIISTVMAHARPQLISNRVVTFHNVMKQRLGRRGANGGASRRGSRPQTLTRCVAVPGPKRRR